VHGFVILDAVMAHFTVPENDARRAATLAALLDLSEVTPQVVSGPR